MSDTDFVIDVTSRIEHFLLESMRAEGSGLGAKAKSIESKLPGCTFGKMMRLATIRNRFAHGKQKTFEDTDRDMFEKLGNDIEEDLRRISNFSIASNVRSTKLGAGPFFLIVNKESGKCLDVADQGTDDGQKIQIWSCSGGDNQKWYLERFEENVFRIVSKHSGKCLDVSGGSTDDGVWIQLWSVSEWNDGNNQKWSLVDLGDGSYQIKAKVSDKCLDVAWDLRLHDGGNVLQWTDHGGDNQRWHFHLVPE